MIEVEVALPGEHLPQASSAVAIAEGEEDPYEVEVVVDFGVAVVEYPALTASNMGAFQQQQQQPQQNVPAASTDAASMSVVPFRPGDAPAPPPPSSSAAQPKEGGVPVDSTTEAVGVGATTKSKRGSALGITLKGGDADDSDRMSDVSESWAEDRYAPVTQEEQQVSYCCQIMNTLKQQLML